MVSLAPRAANIFLCIIVSDLRVRDEGLRWIGNEKRFELTQHLKYVSERA